jgi:serine/threonine protein phosphatase 1
MVPKPQFTSLSIASNLQGRQLVIADIHGCLTTFKHLVEKIVLTTNDQLFLLGDYIDKGKDSVGVLDFLLELKQNNYQIFTLRGNHEQMLLETHHKKYRSQEFLLPLLRKNRGIIDENRKILPKYYDFIANMPYYYELDSCFLVHAGFNLEKSNPFIDFESMLWIRDFSVTLEQIIEYFKGKKVIFGHNPIFLQHIQQDIKMLKPAICLDNGCVFKSKWFLGNLVCLDLGTMELIIQENVEG